MSNGKPVVCTLSDAERPTRGLRWQAVLRRAAKNVVECPNGYILTLHDDKRTLGEIGELVEAERACCAWMNFEWRRGGGVTLSVTADFAEGKAVLDEMLVRQVT